MTLQELLDARNKAVTKCREIASRNEGTARSEWSGEDQQEFDRARKDAVDLKSKYEAAKADSDTTNFLSSLDEWDDNPAGDRKTDANSHSGGNRTTFTNANQQAQTQRDAGIWTPESHFRARSSSERRFDIDFNRRGSEEYNKAYSNYLRGASHGRAFSEFDHETYSSLTAGSEVDGGFFVMPEQMATGIIKDVDDDVFIQARSRVFVVRNARTLGFRKRTAKASTFTKGSELGDVTDALESGLKFGKRALTPHHHIGAAQISRELVATAGVNIEQIYRNEINIDLREYMEQQYMFGTGNQECLGFMVASADGVSTNRDDAVVAGDSAVVGFDPQTMFAYKSLVRAKYSLKQRYRSRAVWMFHRDYFVDLATMTDPEGHLIWQLSARDGEPDRLLGIGVVESEWMPNTRAASNYYGALADFQQYYIAWDAASMETQRLTEIAARNNLIEYHFRFKADGAPMIEEGFTRLQFGA